VTIITDRQFRLFRQKVLTTVAVAGLACAACCSLATQARADDVALEAQLKSVVARLEKQEKQLADQEQKLKHQQDDLANQAALIAAQRDELSGIRSASSGQAPVTTIDASGAAKNPSVQVINAAGPVTFAKTARAIKTSTDSTTTEKPNFLMPLQYSQNAPTSSDNTPTSPVGEAPEPAAPQPQANEIVQSLPVGLAVLTPAQHFIFTPSVEYTQTTNDQLVFEGVVIVPGVNLGEVNASTDDRSIISSVFDVRYGVLRNLEVEARVPLTFSDDRATLLSQGPNGSATQSMYISGKGVGDIQMAARYQINEGLEDWPVFVANLIVKSDTGKGPFDVARNSAGIAEQVAIGSGFWAIQGGFSALKVTDPAILYASANYIYQIPKDINKTIGGVFVGNVDPSNAVSAAFGFGFAVNSEFSFSLGYEHSFVFPQETMLGGTQQSTTSSEVGALTFGMAYKLASNMSLNSNFEFGVTHDAPNMRVVFSLPISY
jgi:hypothetical protein